MSYSYLPGAGADAYRPARRTQASNILRQLQDTLPAKATQWASSALHSSSAGLHKLRNGGELKSLVWKTVRRAFTITNGLIILWIFTLWWGERGVFQESLESCAWDAWEKWPQDARPHHVAFIADPQLVDPHTYPGRRGHSRLLFLGDLFDGGREWGTASSESPEERYRKYTDSFWKQEFHRFSNIFADTWNKQESHSTSPHGRVMIASLPGNHDLGFGSGVQLPVRDRFQNFFGKGNRVDVIGNHTIVSVDTVSLSAMDQPDPHTGSTGAGNGDGERPNQRIWQEAEDFLNNMNAHRGRAEMDELRFLGSEVPSRLFQHAIKGIDDPAIAQNPQPEMVGFPTVLLTHIPLYRKSATPCGPLRERWPPSAEGLEEDDRNALSISGGYQYQNVLTKTISNDVVSKVGPNLIQVYSGDDHDYCEITHREFSGSPKEITVKSLSWAMGVRKPGFVMASLWNPIDPATGQPLEASTSGSTLQNHLCLLPDQLSIFIHYGLILSLTLVVLLVQAAFAALYPPRSDTPAPILPLSEQRGYPLRSRAVSHSSSSSLSSSSFVKPGGLASRAVNNPRATPPQSYPDTYPSPDYAEGVDRWKWKPGSTNQRQPRGSSTLFGRVGYELLTSVINVAPVVLAWYFFLIWRW
ncbi:hypothetical protein ARAM_003446 [Aspergillus rambellii]|uniref:Calcineurin-like phosphoesterase domain-containing protein n=1 Tax=Aspergillus rambellii TaxID=308745 RepID=A0A0F8UW40_9EURO|nr:hypothetical protein ARAM_003446 [Aspergillus rambellii]